MPLTRRTAISAALPLAAGIAAAEAPARAQQPAPFTSRPIFGAKQWRLANGLRVVLAESHRAPVVAHYVFYGAGSGEDPQGIGGVAHFMEHMMFKGSGNVPSGDFSRLVARQGGQDNAFTSRDVTAYYQHVESSRLALVMRMEADRMAGPLFNPAEFEAERSVVIEERRQVVESQPRSKFREAFDAAMWGRQHWRGRPIIGWEEEIRAISREDMLAFFSARYAPGNATLVVAGDVEEARLRELAEQTYGLIPARAFTPRNRGEIPIAPAMPRIEQTSPVTREASFSRAIAAPSATWGETRHAWPLEVLAHVLGGGTGSRLHRALVESGIAVAAGAGYDSDVAGASIFSVSATLRAPNTREALEQIVEAELRRLVQDGVTEAEVARSIRQTTAGAMLALDGLGAAPRMLGGALAIGLPMEDVEHWPEKLRAVTTEQVNEAARAVLVNPLTTAGWLLPA
ncbi:M16 family metallopeptidase [Rhodovarius lipocyclicus]|uniref:M16 family metallopeptidase n=1 Tax=Rhodovarius lipocyclicus TaxID=268410 RepID=UPI00135804B4|nr:pitrilysin family protein [Rhodovarius lipocyclicus]